MTAPVAKAADALLAARTAPWVELLSPKAPAGAGPAQSVLNAARVDNDVLLPHGNALRAAPQAAAGELPGTALPGTPARASSSTDLSMAARVIQNLLADMRDGESGPVRGQAPVWPATRQVPHAAALASALLQQVSDSGLFYESHLAQFAAGTRSLAQMQREPQAGLSRQPADGTGAEAAQGTTPQQQPQRAAQQIQLLPVAAAQAQAAAMPAPAAASSLVAAAPVDMQQIPDAAGADASQPMPGPHDAVASRQQHPQPVGAHATAYAAASTLAGSADAAPVAERAPAAVTAPDVAATAVVHPQAAPLVHQQLDLLASAMFRWSGEAWPGVPMEWTVQEEGGGAPEENEVQPAPQWSTALSLDLPRLGHVELRMKLSGTSLRAHLAAPQREALTQLRVHRSGLSQRLAAAGFELRALQLDAELAA